MKRRNDPIAIEHMFAYGADMRPESEFREALELVEAGLNDCQISRELGIPRGTIRDWRHASAKNPGHRTVGAIGHRSELVVASTNPGGPCTGECDAPTFAMQDRPAYFYLLGQYLGDGFISPQGKGVFRLRIACAWDYPGIAVEVADAMSTVSGRFEAASTEGIGCSYINTYWKHWPCVFPQHGRGRKHERPIVLRDWQRPSATVEHQELIRGLIHSDGCRFINPVNRQLKHGVKRYEYVRYVFTNASSDIRGILTDSLDALEIEWRRMNARNISIARRDSVHELEQFVGQKH
jgi:hypothetical protein